MTRPRSFALLTLLAVLSCNDAGLTVNYGSPSASILNPAGGVTLTEGQWIQLRGKVADPREEPEALEVSWYLNTGEQDELLCSSGTDTGLLTMVGSDGQALCEARIPNIGAGPVTIKLEASNAHGRTGSDAVQVEILESARPVCTLTEPEGNLGGSDLIYHADEPIALDGDCFDEETDPTNLEIWWTVDDDPDLAAGIGNDGDGSSRDSLYLEAGIHDICIHARDESEKTGDACVQVEIEPESLRPVCEITLPFDGSIGRIGGLVRFEGMVEDPDGETTDLEIRFESDHDGVIASPIPLNGFVRANVSDLSTGTHVISLFVEDEAGKSCVDQVEYTVGDGPSGLIEDPVTDDSFDISETIFFQAGYSDDESVCQDLHLTWSEDGGEVLLEEDGDSSCVSAFSRMLPEGSYTVLFTVEDPDGNPFTDLVHFTVGNCLQTWYRDLDGDGYGDPAVTVEDCTQPAGYVAIPDDCDDTNSQYNPAMAEDCNGFDDNCNGTVDEGLAATTFYADTDFDNYGDPLSTTSACLAPPGYVDNYDDCDDMDSYIYPGSVEVCDEEDNDCDGVVDESDAIDAEIWYRDNDNDGFGNSSSTRPECEQPTGYVADASDCNDSLADVYPGATEYCDGTDHDCDGLTLEDGSADASSWYRDFDSDGYGDASSVDIACDPPSGFVADATDCDDREGAAHPGRTETCDEIDNDCDSSIDEGVTSTFYADADGDGYGTSSITADACTAPSGHVANSRDCNDSDNNINPAASEVCNSTDDDCDSAIDDADSSLVTASTSTWYRDADGDGYGDSSTSTRACSRPTGYVSNATDCNDSRSSSYPGASETCNSYDDDCDGSTDEGVTTTFYLDADGDGYGTSSSTTASCSRPSGYSSNASDCNDSRSSTYPGASESCNSIDDDCDGSTDEGVTSTYYRDADGDGYGSSTTYAACSLPSGYATNASDCNDSSSSTYPGASETCNGTDNDCDGNEDYEEGCAVATLRPYDDDCNNGCPSMCLACTGRCSVGSGTTLLETHTPAGLNTCTNLSRPNTAAQIDFVPNSATCPSGMTLSITIYKNSGCTGTSSTVTIPCTSSGLAWNLNCADSNSDGYGDFDDHVDSFRVQIY